jgi:hypothetical protein
MSCASSRATTSPLLLRQELGVADEDAVRGEHDLGVGELVAVAVGAVPAEDLQRGREPPDLALPVAQHRGGADDERGEALAGPPEEVGHELQRLAEPHVVGEQRAEAEGPEGGQPRVPAGLVAAEGAVQAGRARQLGWVADGGNDLAERGVGHDRGRRRAPR